MGGGLNKTLELFEVDDEGEEAEVKAEGKVGLGKILQGIIGFGTSVEGGSSLTASHSSNQVAKKHTYKHSTHRFYRMCRS